MAKGELHLPRKRSLDAFRRRILTWYRCHGRDFPWRATRATQYQRVVSEVLLQRTRAETVATLFPVFIRAYPSWEELSHAPEKKLQVLLQPIGLWRRRATSLRALATEMHRRKGRFPKNREEIDSLPAVGQYVANSIELFVHERATPLLDVNMARVLERYYGPRQLADIRYDPYLQELSHRVVACDPVREINWAILDLAALVCRLRKPSCKDCPLRKGCKYRVDLGRDRKAE